MKAANWIAIFVLTTNSSLISIADFAITCSYPVTRGSSGKWDWSLPIKLLWELDCEIPPIIRGRRQSLRTKSIGPNVISSTWMLTKNCNLATTHKETFNLFFISGLLGISELSSSELLICWLLGWKSSFLLQASLDLATIQVSGRTIPRLFNQYQALSPSRSKQSNDPVDNPVLAPIVVQFWYF